MTVPIEVVLWANRLGLRGTKVVGWVPPPTASDDPRGMIVIEVGSRDKTPADP